MSGQPPVLPPKLSYKSRAQREQEDVKEEEEEEEGEEERRPRDDEGAPEGKEEPVAVEGARPEAADAAPPAPPPRPVEGAPGTREQARAPTPLPTTTTVPVEVDEVEPHRPLGVTAMDEDRSVDGIRMLGAEEEAAEEEAAEGEEAPEEVAPRRRPPRPPKSPDPRPVYAGFILVGVGLVELLYGFWAMVRTPQVGSGDFYQLVRWAYFSQAFVAAFLGAMAIRGGLWSFRKERYALVKIGAISASACVWALWFPWLLGVLALLIVVRARHEYYPLYDPRWDAPSWVRPPPSRRRTGGEGETEMAGETEAEGEKEVGPAGERHEGDELEEEALGGAPTVEAGDAFELPEASELNG